MSIQYPDAVEAITQILRDKFVEGDADSLDFGPETRLLSSGLNLDSVAILGLLLEVENRFGIQFEDSDLSVELFRDISNLAHGVLKKVTRNAIPA
jgi:acyl carrier protein